MKHRIQRSRKTIGRRLRPENGFALPTVIILMMLISTVAYAALLQASNSLSISYKQSYDGMARVAAKSGIDFAQENYTSTSLNYNGTTETTLSQLSGSTLGYRTVFSVEVLSTDPVENEKTVRTTGTVYMPYASSNVVGKYSFVTKISATVGTPPPTPLLYHWFKFDGNMNDAVTGDPKYNATGFLGGGYSHRPTNLPHTTNGNTHVWGNSCSGCETFWAKYWTATAADAFSGDGSVCVWIQSEDGDNDFGTDYHGERYLTIEGYRNNDSNEQIRFDLGPSQQTSHTFTAQSRFLANDGQEWNELPFSGVNSGFPLNDTAWHHHCVTGDDGNMTYYVDGVSRATDVWDAQHNIFGNNVYIKEYSGGSWHDPHSRPNGWIDDFMIWKTTLTPAEVTSVYAGMVTPPTPTGATINDNTTGTGMNQFNYSSGWGYANTANAYDNDEHFHNSTNAQYTLQFSGTRASVYTMRNDNYGIMAISVDGGAETMFDAYNAIRQFDILAYTTPVLPAGNHTIRVRVTGTKNPASSDTYIAADRIVTTN